MSNNFINEKMNQEVFLYCIKYENKPIYIGSTFNINKRQESHNKQLISSIKEGFSNIYLYDFLKNKNRENGDIYKIELIEIKKCFNDIVIIGDNIFEYRRNIEEEKIIRYCLNKGIALLNMKYPCKFWFYENKLIERDINSSKINVNDYKIVENINIFDYITNKNFNNIFDTSIKNIDDVLFN